MVGEDNHRNSDGILRVWEWHVPRIIFYLFFNKKRH